MLAVHIGGQSCTAEELTDNLDNAIHALDKSLSSE